MNIINKIKVIMSIEVPQRDIFMEQKMRFGLVDTTEKKWWPIMSNF